MKHRLLIGAAVVPLLLATPVAALDLEIRVASDAGRPPAAGDGPQADAFAAIAQRLATWLDNQK